MPYMFAFECTVIYKYVPYASIRHQINEDI